jgi:hypothetical protein
VDAVQRPQTAEQRTDESIFGGTFAGIVAGVP